MAVAWITYAWKDNEQRDVDYIAQQLEAAGLRVRLDRWDIGAGRPLWEQIDRFITDPAQSDGWIFIASSNSLQSEPCKEEFRYALHRALRDRSEAFPIIPLFIGPVDDSLIPAGIAVRLYASITDQDWAERTIAAVERRSPQISRSDVSPFHLEVRERKIGFCIEVRPRAGIWAPYFCSGSRLGKRRCATEHLAWHPRPTT